MFTYRLITQGQLVFDAVIDGAGDASSSSLSQSFHAGRDIDPVANETRFRSAEIGESKIVYMHVYPNRCGLVKQIEDFTGC